MPFSITLRVAFDDVDHAGIVYYPRFFHYFHLAFEELLFSAFADRGGYRALIDVRRIGFPAVHVDCDYKRPLRFGDRFRVEVTAAELGEKSAKLRYTCVAEADGQIACVGHVTCAVVDLDRFRAVAMPDDLRAIFSALT